MSEGSGEGPGDQPTPDPDPATGVPPPGNSQLWQDLVQRFAPAVWRVAREYRLDPAEAAEVSRTTWLRLVENLNLLEGPERVGAWLLDTARRESIRVLRLSGRPVRRVIDLAMLSEQPEEAPEVSAEPSPGQPDKP